VDSRDLGAFSVAYATFTFAVGAVRAIAGELLVVRYSGVDAAEWRKGVSGAAGAALTGGMLLGAGCLLLAATVEESFRAALIVVGISLPLLLVQDVWRFAFFAHRRGSAAFVNDAMWAGAMFVAFAMLLRADLSSVGWLTAGWAGAGCIAAFVGVFQLKIVPNNPVAAVRWLQQHRDLAPRFFAEFFVGSGVSHLIVFAVGAIAGLGALGQLRAGEILLGPLNVLFAGVALTATPEFVRLLRDSPRRMTHGCRWLSCALSAGVLAWGAVVMLVPADIGRLVLRDNWGAARLLLLPLLLALVGYASSFGAWTGLRALAAARRSLRARCIDGVLTVLFGLGGAYVAGATGVAWGFAVTGFLKSANAWWQFSAALRERAEGQC
jgi:hypothetical protein